QETTRLLVDVTAILSTSSTLGIVDEAFSVPQNFRITASAPSSMSTEQLSWMHALDAERGALSDTSVSARALPLSTPVTTGQLDSIPVSNPEPNVGPQPGTVNIAAARVPAARLPTLRGVQLLDQLALLTRSELGSFVAKYPDSVSALLAKAPAASEVATFWSQTSTSQHRNMVSAAPQVVGALEGIPYSVRNVANRSYLTTAENRIRSQLAAGVGRAASDELTKQLHMLGQVRAALAVGDSKNPRSLVSLGTGGEGRAIIIIGDASTADYVDYLIPGMFSDVDTQIVAFANSSDNIATQQQAWIKRLNPGVPASQLPTVATFAWIGYQTPNIVNVASMQLAREGQVSFTESLQGLRAERAARVTKAADGTVTPGVQPFVAVLAHSYGSTAAMLSLQDDAVSVDALAIVGSPGSPARSVNQLNVTNRNVWVGAADTDPVPQTGIFGSQPLSAAYGAHRFGVNGVTDPVSQRSLRGAVGHNDYFVSGTESLRNMVLIGINRGDLVLGQDGSAALSIGKTHAAIPSGPLL
ncbi:MAG: alpha/beta hydrolase, partial [Pseudolysinimonas sp.]